MVATGFHVLRDGVAAVHETARHVLAMSRVALGQHGGGLEALVGDLGGGELPVVHLLGRDDRRVGRRLEVDALLELRVEAVELHAEAAGRVEMGIRCW